MGARRLRTVLWYLNLLLLVLAAAVWVQAGTRQNSPNRLCEADFGTYDESECPLRPAVSAERLREFQGIAAVLHGARGAPREPPAREPQRPVRPPLSAFKVAMFIRDGDANGQHGLVLRCKDPAHSETYFLAHSETYFLDMKRTDRGVALLAVRFLGTHAEFDVARGEETFMFHTSLRPKADAGVLRSRGESVGRGARRSSPRSGPVTTVTKVDAAALRSLKILLHRDPQGYALPGFDPVVGQTGSASRLAT